MPDGIIIRPPTFEHHPSGLGVNTATPRISWTFEQIEGARKNWQQEAYEIEINFASEKAPQTFRVTSSASVCVPWPARPLSSRERATVRVRCFKVGTTVEKSGCWSGSSVVEAGLLSPDDWKAQWITSQVHEKNSDGSVEPIRLTKEFGVNKEELVRARLYITSQGCYHATINGKPVGEQCLAPGWQSYKHRQHYQVLDVTRLLEYNNRIDVEIGAGWYASALAWAGGRRGLYGERLSLLAQIVLDYKWGSVVAPCSDDSWRTLTCSIVSSELYSGETYDMARAQSTTAKGMPVEVLPYPTQAKLISPDAPAIRVTGTISPQKIFKSKSGKTLIDFGQNLVGRLRVIQLMKPTGTKVSFAHAEVLEDGELGIRPLRHATSTDTIICDGSELVDWTPKFTFHGFRYVEVLGWTPEDKQCPLTATSLVAEVMHSDMERTGWFECSHPLINQLHENARWSMRGNFLSVPTDCPQRDERLGWTGDIQVFAPSANFLYNTTGMLGNWLDDLAVEQKERNGVPPFVVPDVITRSSPDDEVYWPHLPNAVWDDVAVLLPWSLYQASGDLHMMRKQYESMQAWVDKGVQRGEDGLWDPNLYQLGDWLDPLAPPSEPGNGRTNGTLVADAYLVLVTTRLAETAKLLDDQENLERYTRSSKDVLQNFRDKYITSSGLIIGDTQTALTLAIVFDLLSTPIELQTAGKRLAHLVRLQQFRVATGFAGTPLVLHALTKTGLTNLAYRMLLEQRCPSWMYAVSMGATTIWERWDSMLEDGSINPGEMTSFNHYALGSVVNWLHEVVGGISPMEPGWRKIKVRPRPGGDLKWARVRHLGPYGIIEVEWWLEGDVFKMTVTVPPNSTALVIGPNEEGQGDAKKEAGHLVGSGRYEFEWKIVLQQWPPQAIMPPFWPQAKPLLAKCEKEVPR